MSGYIDSTHSQYVPHIGFYTRLARDCTIKFERPIASTTIDSCIETIESQICQSNVVPMIRSAWENVLGALNYLRRYKTIGRAMLAIDRGEIPAGKMRYWSEKGVFLAIVPDGTIIRGYGRHKPSIESRLRKAEKRMVRNFACNIQKSI